MRMGRQRVGTGRIRRRPASTTGQVVHAGQLFNELRLGNLEWTIPTSPERIARRRRHRFRVVRRSLGAAMALGLLGAIVFTALLLVTPSVGNAPRIIRHLERTHNSAYASRAPARFSAALKAIQDRVHGSRSGSMSGVTEFVGQLLEPSRRDKLNIDQQLASMLYLRGGQGEVAQIERAVLVLKLHWSYSESALMGMYASVAGFGHGYYGLAAASCGYFGQRPAQLSWGQIALLAAVGTNPATDDPYQHFARARREQAAVLRALVAAGTFSRAEVGKIAQQPLHLRSLVVTSRPRDRGRHAGASGCALAR
jgi:Transglycosylase